MDSGSHPSDPRIEQFLARYTQLLETFRVPSKAIPWYKRPIQLFLDDHPGTRLQAQTPEKLERWFERLGRQAHITDWQFRQKVDALRLLFCHLLKRAWAGEFDWDAWSAGARSLGRDHPKVARTYEMIDQTVEEAKNLIGKQFPEIYRKFLVAIRWPDYSLNTERSYLGWINRFLHFHSDKHPCDCVEADIAYFLEHLALIRKVLGATQGRLLEKPLGEIMPYKGSKRPKRVPTVLSYRDIGWYLTP